MIRNITIGWLISSLILSVLLGHSSSFAQSGSDSYKMDLEENGFSFFGLDSGTVDYKIYLKQMPLQRPFNEQEETGKAYQLRFYNQGRKRVYTGVYLNDSGISQIEADKYGYLVHYLDGSVSRKKTFHFFPDEIIKSTLIYHGRSGTGRYCYCMSKKKDKRLRLGKKSCVYFPNFGPQSEVHHNQLDSPSTYTGVSITYYKHIPVRAEVAYSNGYYVAISANNIKKQ